MGIFQRCLILTIHHNHKMNLTISVLSTGPKLFLCVIYVTTKDVCINKIFFWRNCHRFSFNFVIIKLLKYFSRLDKFPVPDFKIGSESGEIGLGARLCQEVKGFRRVISYLCLRTYAYVLRDLLRSYFGTEQKIDTHLFGNI